MIRSSEAILAVADVRQAVRFYRDVLGFESEWFWQDPPTFGGVRWGCVQVMFSRQPELASRVAGHMHMFFADDIEALHERHRAAGAPIVTEIENKSWGVREYTVRDPNGYLLRFGGPPTYERPATATDALPAHICIHLRKPTLDEYVALAEAVGWGSDLQTMPAALGHALFGVVATDGRDGRAVGMLRVCGDGRYYTIWDVIVRPEFQAQKVGSAMMESALAELRRRGPKGAFVGLFTGGSVPAFYERFGFRAGGGMQRAL